MHITGMPERVNQDKITENFKGHSKTPFAHDTHVKMLYNEYYSNCYVLINMHLLMTIDLMIIGTIMNVELAQGC